MNTLARICRLTAISVLVIIAIGCVNSKPTEAVMEPEDATRSHEQERRIYDPVRVEHRQAMGGLNESTNLVFSTGAIIGNTHEAITIIQSQILNPPATAREKVIPWNNVVSAYNLTTEDAIERPLE